MSGSWPVRWHGDIDSTNEEARRRARSGDIGPCWIAARRQTAGRGRLGRSWTSETGNLYATALFPRPASPRASGLLPFAAGLALARAAERLAPGVTPALKWPNDVRVEGRKLAGILLETGGREAQAWIAAGFGLNLAHAPENVGQPTTCLQDWIAQDAPSPRAALGALQSVFEPLASGRGADTIIDDWLGRAEGLGAVVSVGLPDERADGVFEGLEPDGALVLRCDNGEKRVIRAGDVEILKDHS